MSKLGLGKGLSSLLGSDEGDVFGEENQDLKMLDISKIIPNKNQPRKDFNNENLEELADSIRQNGVLSPILIREFGDNKYQIIAGERRFKASKMANLTEIPVRIIQADDKKAAEIALIENLQREDLNIYDQATGYKKLMDDYDLTQEQVAKSVSKSRSAIANILRVLVLSDEILQMLCENKISHGHTRAILSVNDETKHLEFANYIVKNGLNVRQAERHAKQLNQATIDEHSHSDEHFSYFKDKQEKIEESLCRKVKIVYNKKKIDGKGKIELEYLNGDDLENLIEVLATLKM